MRLPLSLWLPLALAVAAVAAGQSPLQRRVVRDVLEYFHGRSNVHFLFKERGRGRGHREAEADLPGPYKFDTGDVPKVLDKYHNCGPSHHLAAKPGLGSPRLLRCSLGILGWAVVALGR
ncbi:hypothetical protein DUI87_33188 [Hirundo rustica rustica]|uniref:Uncharacterized protein n=1 Tax=Hirundo rustica rustica TaxID=333673 RepID=A0A3M0INH9_HIRRU|nr:hypothetical protein DUI87_33188 [Hirundo rustica rustica]